MRTRKNSNWFLGEYASVVVVAQRKRHSDDPTHINSRYESRSPVRRKAGKLSPAVDPVDLSQVVLRENTRKRTIRRVRYVYGGNGDGFTS